jgi:hypothetical protein
MATLAELPLSHYDTIVPNSTSPSQLAQPDILLTTTTRNMSSTFVDQIARAPTTSIDYSTT